jgi:hypothetical protein
MERERTEAEEREANAREAQEALASQKVLGLLAFIEQEYKH